MERRRIRFLNIHPLQVKYLVVIFFSIFLPVLVVGGCLYYLIFQMMAEQLGIPESIAYNLIPVVNKINAIIIAALIPITLILLLWGIVLTNRLLGPLNRLREELKRVSEGDYSVRLKIRKDDDLQSLVDVINTIIDKLEDKKR